MTGLVTFFQYPFIQFREAERKQFYISPCPQSRRKSYELLYDLKQLSLDPDHPASFGLSSSAFTGAGWPMLIAALYVLSKNGTLASFFNSLGGCNN